MKGPPAWRRYLRFWGPDREADIEDELSFHLESRVEDLIRQGLPDPEARERALREFGDAGRIRSDLRGIARRRTRRTRRAHLLGQLASGLRLTPRRLLRDRGFFAAAVLTLALGIGANTGMFSLVRAVLLQPLPYAEPERLVVIWEHNLPRDRPTNVVSPANYLDWRERSRSFDAMGVLVPSSGTLTGSGEALRVYGASVSPEVFTMLGVDAAVGRTFVASDVAGGDTPPLLLLSHALWRSAYGGDPSIVGRTVTLSGEPQTVVGVMPRGFQTPDVGWLGPQDFWTTGAITEEDRSSGRWLIVLARRRAGVSLEAASEEMRAVAAALEAEQAYNAGWTANVVALDLEMVGPTRRSALLVLMAAVGLLLLLTCANVATLLLSRAARGRHELAVRAALGASRGQLLAHVLSEAVVVAGLGAAGGLALGLAGLHGLRGLLPSNLPGLADAGLSPSVLVFTGVVSLGALLLFGLAPALRASSQGAGAALRGHGRGSVATDRSRRALVVAEVALAVVLCIGAGLAARTFAQLRSVDPGWDAGSLIAARIAFEGAGELSSASEADPARLGRLDAILERVRALPGVDGAALVDRRPLGGLWRGTSVHLPGEEPEAGTAPVADLRVASGDWFRVTGTRLLAGRTFGLEDHGDAPLRAVVNAFAARTLWPDRDPIGQRFIVHTGEETEVEVVGVAEDVLLYEPAQASRSQIWFSHRQWTPPVLDIVVRTRGPLDAVMAGLRAAVREADPALPVYDVVRMDRALSATLSENRLTMLLLLLFAGIAVLLASVGIYGVLASEVAARRRELGIRLALGARPRRLVRMVVRQGVLQAAAGLVLGTAAAFAGVRLMEGLLYGITPRDPVTFLVVAGVLLGVALLSAWLPARRATRVDPVESLRGE